MVKNEYSYTSTPRMAWAACTQPQCLYNGALYIFTLQPNERGLTVEGWGCLTTSCRYQQNAKTLLRGYMEFLTLRNVVCASRYNLCK